MLLNYMHRVPVDPHRLPLHHRMIVRPMAAIHRLYITTHPIIIAHPDLQSGRAVTAQIATILIRVQISHHRILVYLKHCSQRLHKL